MAMISHELRTPLTGVLSMAEMLEEQIAGPLNARQAYYVKASRQRRAPAERRQRHPRLHPSALRQGPAAGRALRPRLPARRLRRLPAAQGRGEAPGIAVRVEPPDLTITSDATALAEVLKRLVDNAIKFTPDGGRIGLEAHPSPARAPLTPIAVDLVVWDTGIGIARRPARARLPRLYPGRRPPAAQPRRHRPRPRLRRRDGPPAGRYAAAGEHARAGEPLHHHAAGPTRHVTRHLTSA